MIKLSETLCKSFKDTLIQSIQEEVEHFLVDLGGGKALMPFYTDMNDSANYSYFLIEDLDAFSGFDKLEQLVEKYLETFSDGDHLTAVIDGKTVKSVKFYIARGLTTLNSVIEEYAATVAINHKIFSRLAWDGFRISENGKDIIYFSEKKR